jgi:hypothetical protein
VLVTWPHALAIGALVGVCGQVGDLVESLFKRDAASGDSSDLIPGHGGVPRPLRQPLFRRADRVPLPARRDLPGAVRALAVLGSTGSIGEQTLDVAARESARLHVTALARAARWIGSASRPRAGGRSTCARARRRTPPAAREQLRAAAPRRDVEVGPGAAARLAARCGAPLVVNGIVGAAGLAPSLASSSAARGSRSRTRRRW